MSVGGKFVTCSVLNRSFTEYPAMVKTNKCQVGERFEKIFIGCLKEKGFYVQI